MNKSLNLASIPMKFSLWVLFLLPTIVFGECPCDLGQGVDKNLVLKYKVAAIAPILVAGVVGVCLPVVGLRFPVLNHKTRFFLIIKTFAAGVILSASLIHILPDAYEKLKSSCIPSPWGDFPFTGFIAMVSAILTLMFDTYEAAIAYDGRRWRATSEETTIATNYRPIDNYDNHATDVNYHTNHATHVHSHVPKVFEMGIVVHSMIIWIGLGLSKSPSTIRPLLIALTFYQFLEGVRLTRCINPAMLKYNTREVTIVSLVFSIVAPSWIAVGIAISNLYSDTSVTMLIVEGVFNSTLSGILIYIALVDLLVVEFMSTKFQINGKLILGANVSLLVGAVCMSLLPK